MNTHNDNSSEAQFPLTDNTSSSGELIAEYNTSNCENTVSEDERKQDEKQLRFDYECHTWHTYTISNEKMPMSDLEQLQILAETREPVPCHLDLNPETVTSANGDYTPTTAQVALVSDATSPIRLICLLAQPQSDEAPIPSPALELLPLAMQRCMTHRLNASYPECDGAIASFKLTAIHEWEEGLEATLVGQLLQDNEYIHRIAFFDTRYALNKHRYRIGETYPFSLSALSYATFKHDDFYEASLFKNIFSPWSTMGLPPQLLHFYAENFNFEGVINAATPFQWNGNDFYQLHLDLFAGAWDEMYPNLTQYIPLYIKSDRLVDLSPSELTQGRALTGMLWIQGHLIEERVSDTNGF